MLAALPLAHRPLSAGWTPPATPPRFVTLVQEEEGAGQYLVEITAYKGGEIRTGGRPGLGSAPVGKWPLAAAVPSTNANAGEVQLLFADRHWVGEPDDRDKPNVFYEGRVSVPLVIDRNLPLLPEEDRRVQRQFGSIEILNADGALDDPTRYAVGGRRVRVLFGPHRGAYRDFGVIADVLGTGWEVDEGTAKLLVRGRGYSLDLPLQSNLYDGSGGAEGGSEIAGKPKPLAYGRCRNITPVLVDPALLTYQAHDGKMEAWDAVYDRGATLTFGVDHATYTDLAAATIAAGHYDTCLAAGFMRLGSSPDGLVTADIRGDASPDYASALDTIALRVIIGKAGIADRFINAASFAGAATVGGEMGIYISSDETPSAADALNALFAAAAAWWTDGARDGRIGAGRLPRPETRIPTFYLDEYRIISVEPESPPVPRYRQRVAYQRNWTPQQTDLAASVDDARRQFLAGPQRVVTWLDLTIRVRHPQASDALLLSLYDSADDAQAVADSIGALFGPDRGIWRVTVKRFGYLLDLGQVGRITYPRLGLAGGRNVVVIGIREDSDREETVLRVFG